MKLKLILFTVLCVAAGSSEASDTTYSFAVHAWFDTTHSDSEIVVHPDSIEYFFCNTVTEQLLSAQTVDGTNETRMVTLTTPAIPGYYTLRCDAIAFDGTPLEQFAIRKLVAVLDPSQPFLGDNYPEPCSDSTHIPMWLPKHMEVTITLFNVLGQKATTLAWGAYPAGFSLIPVQFGSLPVANGIYFFKLEAPGFASTRKLYLVR